MTIAGRSSLINCSKVSAAVANAQGKQRATICTPSHNCTPSNWRTASQEGFTAALSKGSKPVSNTFCTMTSHQQVKQHDIDHQHHQRRGYLGLDHRIFVRQFQ